MIRAIIFDYSGTLGGYGEPPYEGIPEMLDAFRSDGVAIGILSRSPERHIALSGVRSMADIVWCERVKSDDEFREMANELGAELPDTLIVGDSYDQEIAAGRRLGAKTFHADPDDPSRILGLTAWMAQEGLR